MLLRAFEAQIMTVAMDESPAKRPPTTTTSISATPAKKLTPEEEEHEAFKNRYVESGSCSSFAWSLVLAMSKSYDAFALPFSTILMISSVLFQTR